MKMNIFLCYTQVKKRQIYNKKALEKAQQANRTQRPKRNIGKEIIQELEQLYHSVNHSIKQKKLHLNTTLQQMK